ncbi:MAG: bifunctional phosphoribosylaminoimidazolecarboxamide formyltransferase/IMP cyclohydrolase PurH, partial [Marinilabiliales bacterium]
LLDAWNDALAGDPVSAFGGVLATNRNIDLATANEINKIFFEIIIAPSYDADALEVLKTKKNRIILEKNSYDFGNKQFRSALNGVLVQDKDLKTETTAELKQTTKTKPNSAEIEDLLFANKLVKHTKSNTIVLAKNKQLVGSGTGQTSRVDALRQAIEKAKNFELPLEGAVMASDAFFPFADSVEIAHKAGIKAVIQPGGSIRDNDSIEYCNENGISMVFTGIRHFKH